MYTKSCTSTQEQGDEGNSLHLYMNQSVHHTYPSVNKLSMYEIVFFTVDKHEPKF